MVSNGPYAAEGWMEFLEDEDEVWTDAFETDESGAIDVDHYDEFENMQEIVNFVAGTGTYNDSNGFVPTEEDKDMRKREMHNDQWKIPEKVNDVLDHLAQGEPYSEVDIDPNAEKGWNISEQDARRDKYDTKYTAHFIAYDPDDDSEGGAAFYMAFSWYDDDPDSFNLEEKIDMEDIDDILDGEEE